MNSLRRYLPVVMWCVVIFYFSSLESTPTVHDTIWNFLIRKTAHLGEYAILYGLFFRAINWEKKPISHWQPLIPVIIYAATDEFHQNFVPGRQARIQDVGIDTIGAVIMLTAVKLKLFNYFSEKEA